VSRGECRSAGDQFRSAVSGASGTSGFENQGINNSGYVNTSTMSPPGPQLGTSGLINTGYGNSGFYNAAVDDAGIYIAGVMDSGVAVSGMGSSGLWISGDMLWASSSRCSSGPDSCPVNRAGWSRTNRADRFGGTTDFWTGLA
jgi:hypothetical protein